jgi:hypothetical protein
MVAGGLWNDSKCCSLCSFECLPMQGVGRCVEALVALVAVVGVSCGLDMQHVGIVRVLTCFDDNLDHNLCQAWKIALLKFHGLGIQDGEVRPEPGDLRDIALRWRFHRVQICNIPYFGKTYHSNWSVQVWCRDTRNPVCFLLSYQREQMLFGQNHVHFLCGDIRQRKLGSNLPSFR